VCVYMIPTWKGADCDVNYRMLTFPNRTVNTGRTRREPDKNVECSPKINLMKLMIVLNILLNYSSDALQR
jgi:hypothetical protein